MTVAKNERGFEGDSIDDEGIAHLHCTERSAVQVSLATTLHLDQLDAAARNDM